MGNADPMMVYALEWCSKRAKALEDTIMVIKPPGPYA
jgi:hypothetical protein